MILDLDAETFSGFLAEFHERLNAAEGDLLALENDAKNRAVLNSLFRIFHTIKGDANILAFEDMALLAHATEDLLDLARNGDILLTGPALDVAFESVDQLRHLFSAPELTVLEDRKITLEPAVAELAAKIRKTAQTECQRKKGCHLDQSGPNSDGTKGKFSPKCNEMSEEGKSRDDESVSASQGSNEFTHNQGVNGKDRCRSAKQASCNSNLKEMVKIDTDRMDRLLDAIGELGIIASMVSQDEEILRVASDRTKRNMSFLKKTTREVQEIGAAIRMTPIRPIFDKMARVVRDLAKQSAKEIAFVTSGANTELDRCLVEKIYDPLLHLVRNAVGHGIETPDERLMNGKPEKGVIHLRASHQGGAVIIEIIDDGRGLDRERIFSKAVEHRLAAQDDNLREDEVFNFLFHSGLSTAKEVTNLSGRGVGMDIVKRFIDTHNGHVALRSKKDTGTSITMRLPLMLAIVDGMVVVAGDEQYIIPVLSICESIQFRREMISSIAAKGTVIDVRGALYPFHHLDELLGFCRSSLKAEEGLAVLVEDKGRRIALFVDQLIGQQQVVIKRINDALGEVPGVSGAAIMPTGRVALVLDIAGILKLIET